MAFYLYALGQGEKISQEVFFYTEYEWQSSKWFLTVEVAFYFLVLVRYAHHKFMLNLDN